MKIAMLGLGDIAQKAYLPIMAQLPDIELVLCTRNRQTLKQLSAQYRIQTVVSDYRELPGLGTDAVMIHSATSTHAEIARYFLQQGIPCFVDKPLADNGADCERLYELAQRKKTPLYLGFNRRFIPLFEQHLPGMQQGKLQQPLLALCWQKNRYNLPGDIRTFIFDDFIHPLDSINIRAKRTLDELFVTTQFTGKQLARLDVQWQDNGTILAASMNRMNGQTNEHVSVNLPNESYLFDSFTSGVKAQGEQTQNLRLKDWTSMLESKGFTAMLNDWLKVVDRGELENRVIERNLASHQLAEAICQKVETQG